MLRGGSFANDQQNARGAARNRNNPENRNDNIGFRVVLSTFFFVAGNAGRGGEPFQAEAKNGGARSRPRPEMSGPGE